MITFSRYDDTEFSLSHSLSPVPDPSRFVLHTHAKAELYYFVRGEGIFHIEGSVYPLKSGDLLLMQSAESHYIELDRSKPYERIVLHFDLDVLNLVDPQGFLRKPFLSRNPGKQNRYHANQFRGGSCEHYFKTMLRCTPDPRISIFAGLIPLLYELCQLINTPENIPEDAPDTIGYQIMRYLNQNIDKHLSLDDICRQFYISKSQLCRIFRDSAGVTVKQYINVKRLVKAKQLLDAGDAPTRVYLQCGFSDYSSFYRAYVKYFGTTPSKDTTLK